ncbi:MAG: MBL fold metallo-hydrolase [Alphaproteobacteria bacterium]|nr:MBL fold metallo-hydrolase [Alphaproteobacteria bacterium]
MIRTAFLTLAAAGLVTSASAAQEQEVYVETSDLGAGVYMLSTGRGGNVGLSVGEDGVFLIDTQFAPIAPYLDRAQRAVSGDRGVDMVLNTHLHGDHVLGNEYFAEAGAIILAHESVRPALENPVTAQLTGSTPDPLSGGFLPTVNLVGGETLTLNGQTVRLHHEPSAHTDGDIWVQFVEADVIHAGDLLFSGWFPYIDLDNGGTVEGFIAGMQAIADAAGPDTQVIPGHGPMSTKADLEASIAMLSESRARVAALVADGHDYQAVLDAEPLADFHDAWNWGFITTERMIWTLYRDITGEIPQR